MTPTPNDMPAYPLETLHEMFSMVNVMVPALVTALQPVAATITDRSAVFDLPFPYGNDTHRMRITALLVEHGTPNARYQITVTAKHNMRAFRRDGMVQVLNDVLGGMTGFCAGVIHLDGGNAVTFSVLAPAEATSQS